MVADKRYFARRAFEEAGRAARAQGAEARQWHQELADKFSRLAEEVSDPASHRLARPKSNAPDRRAALG